MGGNTVQYQDHREGLRTLPLKAMECGTKNFQCWLYLIVNSCPFWQIKDLKIL